MAKISAPAALRNREPIRDVLARYLSRGVTDPVLEIAAGSGEHASFFASAFPYVPWQPTDRDEASLASIAAYRDEAQLPNFHAPLSLDVTTEPWPVERAQLVLCINMIHISPWEATLGLCAGAARVLDENRYLFLYGPYRFFGAWGAPSNAAFDESLKSRDARWGVRDLADVAAAATSAGFVLHELVAMPANNHCVIFRRR